MKPVRSRKASPPSGGAGASLADPSTASAVPASGAPRALAAASDTSSSAPTALPMTWVQEGEALLFWVHAQPGASRDGVLGVVEGALKVRISAPPVEGAANERLLRYLAKEVLHIRPAALELVSGEQARHKRVRVTGLTPEVLVQRLSQALPTS